MPLVNDFCICVLQIHHDHILTGYFRQNKILKLICCRYTWSFIYVNIKSFCKSCITCIRSKLQCYKLYESLKQLLIPENLWNLVSINFIKKLSSSSSFNIILVIINQLSKQTIFILVVDIITLYDLAKLFIIYIFSKHGILSHITSNCKYKFVLNFF